MSFKVFQIIFAREEQKKDERDRSSDKSRVNICGNKLAIEIKMLMTLLGQRTSGSHRESHVKTYLYKI